MANGFYLIIMSFLYHEIGVENVKLIGLGDMRGKSTTNILCSNDFAGSKSDKKLGVLITKWNDESNVLINMQKVKIINYPLCSFIKIMENTKKNCTFIALHNKQKIFENRTTLVSII